jgi:hypothetical protein
MSREEVDWLLGRSHRFSVGTHGGLARANITSKGGRHLEERIYEEGQGPSRKRAFVTFEMRNFTVTDKEFVDEPTDPGHVSEANFAKIRKGMTREEVDALLGREHQTAYRIVSLAVGPEITYKEGQGTSRKIAIVTFDGISHKVTEKEFKSKTPRQGK